MKHLLYIISILSISAGMGQEQLNDYKYIIVPKRFEEFKKVNQHQTSTLVKYLFAQKGFNAVYDDELPQELADNRCLGLTAKLVDGSSMFTTKAAVQLENCNGQEIFSTKEGKSKEKDYKASYGEALRESFASFDSMDYQYNGTAGNSGPVTVNMQKDVKTMDEDKSRMIQQNPERSPLVEQEATRENQRYVDRRPKESNFKKAESGSGMVEQEATQENQRYEDKRPVESDLSAADMKSGTMNNSVFKGRQTSRQNDAMASGNTQAETVKEQMPSGDGGLTADQNKTSNAGTTAQLSGIASTTLYAQELPNGFQLVDSTPKIRLKIQKTSTPGFYLAEAGDVSGAVFKKDGTWLLEYYDGENLQTEELNIKF